MSKKATAKKIKTAKAIRIQYTLESIHDEELTQVEFPTSYREYDPNGNILQDISWDHNGVLSEKFAFAYEGKKKIAESLYLDEEEIAEHHTFSYEGEQISSAKITYLDGHEEQCTYTYEDGKLISKECMDDEGDEGEKEYFSYENGMLTRYEKHGDFGLEEITTQKWDGKLLLEKDQELVMEEDRVQVQNQYNEKGLLIKSMEEKAVGQSRVESSYSYDEQDQLVEVQQNDNGENHTIRYRYNDKGDEVYMDDTAHDGQVNFTVEREYDDWGNVLESRVEIFSGDGLTEAKYTVKYAYTFFE